MDAEQIFLAAVEKKTFHQREACLDSACRDNAEIRSQVESWLASNDQAGSFLKRNRSHSDGDIVLDSSSHRLSFLRHLLHVARYRQALGDCGYIGTASA
jgi:hypothetical protein